MVRDVRADEREVRAGRGKNHVRTCTTQVRGAPAANQLPRQVQPRCQVNVTSGSFVSVPAIPFYIPSPGIKDYTRNIPHISKDRRRDTHRIS